MELFTQLIEEAIIYAYEDAMSGAASTYSTASSLKQSSDLFKFLTLSLDFMELAISKQFAEFLPSI